MRYDVVYRSLLALILALLFCVGAVAEPAPLQETEIPEYDYSQTQRMVLYGKDDLVYMGDPFEHPTSIAVPIYRTILQYAAQLQPLAGLPDRPVYVLDLLMRNKDGRFLLGQRLYIGDSWLSDGKSLTPMKRDDYQRLAKLLDQRFNIATRYDIERSDNLRRPREHEYPEPWLPEKISVKVALERMSEADTGYPTADSDIQSAQRQNEENERTDADDDSAIPAGMSDEPHAANPVEGVPSSVVVIAKVADTASIVTEATSDNSAEELSQAGEDDIFKRQRWFLYAVLALIGLLILRRVLGARL